MWTNKGKLIMTLCVILFFSAMFSNIQQIYILFSFFFSLLLVSYILFPSNLRGVSAKKYLSDTHAFEGEKVGIKFDIVNNNQTKFFLEIWSVFPNILKKNGGQDYIVTRLSKNQIIEFSYSIECYKRGNYSIGPIKIRTTDPFGFFVQEDEIPIFYDLIVYPNIINIDGLPLKPIHPFIKVGNISSPVRGSVGEFHDLREYVYGDDLRSVHWKSSARLGNLVVKEFEQVTFTDVTLFLDMDKLGDMGIGKETTFEYAVKIAASISNYLIKKQNNVALIAYGQKREVINLDRGHQQFIRILNFLTRCEADGELPIGEVIRNEEKLLEPGSTTIIITTSNDKNFINSVLSLRAKNIPVIVIMLDIHSFNPCYEIDSGE
jgi:uncharacterized protein (DUF58 family)